MNLLLWNKGAIPKRRTPDQTKIIAFWRPFAENGIFSQWYPAKFTLDGTTYASTEQFMMAHKAKLFGDAEIYVSIMATDDPKVIRELGRKVKDFAAPVWAEYKYAIVCAANYLKFTQNRALKEALLTTGDAMLVEASPYDRIWGVGLSADDPLIKNPCAWKGKNLLGEALMEVRDVIRSKTLEKGDSMGYTICFTGHRPKDLFGYHETSIDKWTSLRQTITEVVCAYANKGVTRFITGGAQGIDQLAFWAVREAQRLHPSLPIVNDVFIPFKGQESRWAEYGLFGQSEYRSMLDAADYVDNIEERTPTTDRIKLLYERNLAMLDESDTVIAGLKFDAPLFAKGGTAHTVRNAASKNLPVHCIDPYTHEHAILYPKDIFALKNKAAAGSIKGCVRDFL